MIAASLEKTDRSEVGTAVRAVRAVLARRVIANVIGSLRPAEFHTVTV